MRGKSPKIRSIIWLGVALAVAGCGAGSAPAASSEPVEKPAAVAFDARSLLLKSREDVEAAGLVPYSEDLDKSGENKGDTWVGYKHPATSEISARFSGGKLVFLQVFALEGQPEFDDLLTKFGFESVGPMTEASLAVNRRDFRMGDIDVKKLTVSRDSEADPFSAITIEVAR